MNEQLTKALLSFLEKATNTVQDGISFLSGQLPDIVQQLIVFNLVKEFLLLVAGLVVTLSCIVPIYFGVKYHKVHRDEYTYEGIHWVLVGLYCIVAGIGGSITTINSLTKIVQLWLAPKIWLIEYAASLVKGH